jgi:diguanylate cyclase (GGDEF)-like protein
MQANHMKDGENTRLHEENRRLRDTVTQMEARIVELEQLADTDTLTPLPNRRAFLRRIDAVIRYCDRHKTPAAIVFIDLDRLKRINDDYGHKAGDIVLQYVAGQLSANLRASDMVARIGGDEFGLILDHLDQADACAKATALMDQIAATKVNIGGTKITVSVTAGVAMVQPDDTVDTLMARADDAMYAKRLYRSQT